jgi:hypothetical protein
MDAVKSVPRVFRPLPDDASEEQKRLALVEMANAYATVAHALAFELPAIKEGLELDRAERRLAKEELARFNTELLRQGGLIAGHTEAIGHITGRIEELEAVAANDVSAALVAKGAAPSPYDPGPMRAEMPSGLNLERARVESKELVSQSFQHMASVTPGPINLVTAKPESLTEIAGNIFDEKIRDLQREQAEKAELTRLHAIETAHTAALAEDARLKKKRDDDAEDARKTRKAWVRGIAASLTVLLIAWAASLMWVKLVGHDQGVADQKAATPIVTVPVPVPVPSPLLAAPMAPATATSAPASAVPHH